MIKLFYYAVFIVFSSCYCFDLLGNGARSRSETSYDVAELEDFVRKINGKVEKLEKTVSEMHKELDFLRKSVAGKAEDDQNPASKKEFDPNGGKSAEEVIKIACELIDDNSIEEARESLSAYIKKHPKDLYCGVMYFHLGNCYFKEKDYRNAALQYMDSYKANSNGSKSAEALYKLAVCFRWLSKKTEAISTLDKLIRDYPRSDIIAKAKKERAKLK